MVVVVAVRVVDGSITHVHESITLVMRSDIATSIHVQPLAIDNHNPTTAPPICGVSIVSTFLSLSTSSSYQPPYHAQAQA